MIQWFEDVHSIVSFSTVWLVLRLETWTYVSKWINRVCQAIGYSNECDHFQNADDVRFGENIEWMLKQKHLGWNRALCQLILTATRCKRMDIMSEVACVWAMETNIIVSPMGISVVHIVVLYIWGHHIASEIVIFAGHKIQHSGIFPRTAMNGYSWPSDISIRYIIQRYQNVR